MPGMPLRIDSFVGLELYPVNWKPFIPLLKQTKSPHFSEKNKLIYLDKGLARIPLSPMERQFPNSSCQ